MPMSNEAANAVDTWIVDRLTQVIDTSWQRAHDRLCAAAVEGVTEGMGTGYGREEYEDMHRGRGDRSEWAAVVGLYVTDALTEMLDEEMPDDMWRMILLDLLTLTDSSTRMVFGEHYLPEPDDVDWPPMECGVCGGESDECTPDECAYDGEEGRDGIA